MRVSRAFRRFGKVLGALVLGLVVLAAIAVAALFYLDIAPLRNAAVERINAALVTSFRGDVELTSVGRLNAGVLENARLVVRDPRGREVLRLEGVSGSYDVWTLLRSFLNEAEPVDVTIDHLEVADAHVVLERGPSGELTLLEAFAARQPTAEKGRGARIHLQRIAIGHVWVHGGLDEVPIIDADLSQVRAAFASTPDRLALELNGTSFVLRGIRRNVTVQGKLDGVLSLEPSAPEKLSARANVVAHSGQLSAALHGSFAKERLDAELDVPKVAAQHVRAIFPELPLYAPVTLRGRVQGTLSELAAEAQATIGAGRVQVEAHARLGTLRELDLKLDAERLDVRAFLPDAPATSLDLRGALRGRLLGEGRSYAEFSTESKSSVIASTAVPAVSVEGRVTERSLVAHARVHEPGAPAIIDVAFTPASGARPAHVDLEGRVSADLARFARLPERLSGRADVRVSAEVELPRGPGEPSFHARLAGEATRVVHASASARTLSFSGTIDGPVAAPELALRADARDVTAAGRQMDQVTLAANGPLKTPRVDLTLRGPDLPETRAQAVISFEDGLSARVLSAELRRGGITAEARASRVALREGVVTVDALRVSGIGELDASARIGPRTLRLKAHADALRLDELARLTGVRTVQRGTANFDVALRTDRGGLYGNVTASLRDLELDEVENGSVDADLSFEGQSVRGSLDAALGKAVSVSATSSGLRLPREPLSLRSLRKLEGDVRMRGSADLGALVRTLPSDQLPFAKVRGTVEFDATVSRNDTRHELEVGLQAKTTGLMLAGRGARGQILTRQRAMKSAPWELSGVDAILQAKLTNRGVPSRLNLRLVDRRGNLAELDAEATLRPSELVKPATAPRHALAAPLRAKLSVAERSIDDLPRLLRPHELKGKVALTAELAGELKNPQIRLDVTGKGLAPRTRRDALPADANARVWFKASKGRAEIAVARRGTDVLRAESNFSLAVAELLHGRDPHLQGSAMLRAQGFELQSIPWVKDRQIEGRVHGALALAGLGNDAKLDGELTMTEMRIGTTPVRELRWSVHAKDADLHSEISLRHSDGYALAKLDAGVLWGSRLVPKLDESKPLVARLKSKDLRAGVLLPLVDQTVAKLDARVDADIRAELGAGRQRLEGGAVIRQGVVQVPAIGQELRRIRARIDLHPNGTVFIRDVSAHGVTGRVRAAAALRLQGQRMVAARANVRIEKGEKLPLTVEGVSLGEAWGALDIEARSPSPELTRVDVDVRSFHLDLPEKRRQKLQSLEPPDRVRVGMRQASGQFIVLPLQPLKEKEDPSTEPSELRVDVKLGKDVWIRQGTMLRVKLDGAIALRILDEPRMLGQIQLSRGRIDVQGKYFEIVNGIVTFHEDPENPTIVATAQWESPDGIVVYAEFTGPVKNGTLRLRSEPALSQDEILALLLFGTPDGSFGAGQAGDGGKAATATAVGGGVATKGLNAGLARLTDMDVQTRIDTSDQSPRPELAVQVSRRVTAELAYVVAEPAPGKPPDRTFFTLDFRLGRRWSLATTFGDRGSSLLDLLWRYRY